MKKSLKILIILVLVCAALVFGVNAIVVASASGDLVDEAQAGDGQADCIMVLGAEVKPDGTGQGDRVVPERGGAEAFDVRRRRAGRVQ